MQLDSNHTCYLTAVQNSCEVSRHQIRVEAPCFKSTSEKTPYLIRKSINRWSLISREKGKDRGHSKREISSSGWSCQLVLSTQYCSNIHTLSESEDRLTDGVSGIFSLKEIAATLVQVSCASSLLSACWGSWNIWIPENNYPVKLILFCHDTRYIKSSYLMQIVTVIVVKPIFVSLLK